MPERRPYQATLTDRDGDEHQYRFVATNMWDVTAYIGQKMYQDGDFFGHVPDNTVTLEVAELVVDVLVNADYILV